MRGRGRGPVHGRGRGSRRRGAGTGPGRVACVLLPALLTLLAAACTADGRSGGGPSGAPGAATPGEIVIASGRDVTGKGGIRQQLIDAWNERQEERRTGWTARLVELPGAADQQRSQLLGALQSGSAEYDVVNLDVTWVPEFAAAGVIRPLAKELLDRDMIDAVARTGRWKDDVVAVPFNSDVGLLYYRKDYLAKAGVKDPDLGGTVRTWDRLRSLVRTVDTADGLPDSYTKGWTTQLAPYEGRTVNAVEAFASVGAGGLVDAEGRYASDPDRIEDGLGELKDRTDGAYTLADATSSYEADTLDDFEAGRTAFLRHWPYAYRTLHQALPASRLGVAPLPGKAVLGGQNLAVSSDSPRAGAAADLIRFLTDKVSERCLLDAGFAATRRSAYTDANIECGARAPRSHPDPSTRAGTGTRAGADAGKDDDAGRGAGKGGGGSPGARGERTSRMPLDGDGRPAYAARTLLPALEHAVQRPRTPLYGAFTGTFAARLGPLFGDGSEEPGSAAAGGSSACRRPATDAALAVCLDRALREALPPGG